MDDTLKMEVIEKLSQEGWSNEEITNVINNSFKKDPPPPKIREVIVKLSEYGWNTKEIAIAFDMSKAEVELIIEISQKL